MTKTKINIRNLGVAFVELLPKNWPLRAILPLEEEELISIEMLRQTRRGPLNNGTSKVREKVERAARANS